MGQEKEPTNHLCFFYTTFPSQEKAKEIIKALLKDKLLVCANLFPISSLYIWEEKVQDDIEIGCYLKTVSSKKELFCKSFIEKHPYDVPCLIEITLGEVHQPYLNWAKEIIL